MKKVNYAAIDIGSNAVRLLIKSANEEPSEELFTKALLLRVPLRLGEDAFTRGEISAEKEKNLIRLVKAFRQLMKIYEVADYRACATSAMRDARNGQAVVRKVEKKTGIRIDIISGNEEARIVYDNHIENKLSREQNYIYVDVGGGSTEISLISGGELKSSKSYNVGTVRMLKENVRLQDYEALCRDLTAMAADYPGLMMIGSGGNINKLFRLAGEKDLEEGILPVESLKTLADTLKRYDPKEREKQFHLKPDRAEVIVPAAEIFLEVARCSEARLIWVPTIGLVDGIIDSLYARPTEKKADGKPASPE